MQGVAIPTVYVPEIGVADADRVLQDGRENRLKIARRTADNSEHVRRRRLLLQSLCEVRGAPAQFVEQPRTLDGDDGLRREVGDEFDLLVIERTNLLPEDTDDSDQFVVLNDRHAERGSN